MVRKLYKHEFLAWIRVLGLFWIATLGVAAMHRLLQLFEFDSIYYQIINGFALVVYIGALLASFAAPVVFGVIRFYRNFFTGEGYLTFTLPVTQANHLWVKVSTAVYFSVISFLVAILSFMIITAGDVHEEVIKAANYLLKNVTSEEKLHLLGWCAEMAVLWVVALFSSHLLYDTCICIGQLARKNRVLAAVGVYFGIYIGSQIFGSIIGVVIVALSQTGFFDRLGLLIEEHTEVAIHCFFGIGILLAAVVALVYWLICHSILRKRLNLE